MFPYALPELDLAAPFDRHRAVVRPEWIDANGHMNVGFYVVAFDHATDAFCEQLGVAWPYVEHRLGRVFILEANITYAHELAAGDALRVTTRILDFDKKRLHFFHAMHHGTQGFLAATNELLMMNIGFDTRRAAPWPAETLRRIGAMAASHAALPRPPQAGRVIAIRRGGGP